MKPFEFATAGRIFFGAGTLPDAVPSILSLGRRVLVVTGRDPQRARRLIDRLGGAEECRTFSFAGEPTIAEVTAGAALARSERSEVVVGLGGGSAIDGGKAIAALAANPGPVMDYLEVVGRGQALERMPLPYVAVPTTAGTGAEVTRNAVLTCPEQRVKASLRSPTMLPRLAVVDPELTLGLPARLTAATGLDALTQLIEPLVSIRANPLTDGFCREGIPRVARSLRQAWANPADGLAREDLALASLLSGLALANAGLGVVHGFAAPIGGMFPAPHGAVCAALLAPALAVNLRACRERGLEPALARFDEVARLLTGRSSATADEAVAWLEALVSEVDIPPLRLYGMGEADVPTICAKASQASSMKGNPVPLRNDELEAILRRAL